MFTAGALVFMILIMWFAQRKNEQDRPMYDRALPDERVWILVLHLRQDLKAVVFLLAGVMVMLGVIADRIHWVFSALDLLSWHHATLRVSRLRSTGLCAFTFLPVPTAIRFCA